MSFTKQPSLEQIRARITKTLKAGIQLDMSTEECKKLLIIHELFLEPFRDVQLTFVVAHVRIYQNPFDDISKSLSFVHHILLAMIIHN